MIHPDTRPISFTYPRVAPMWVVTLHNLFLYSDPPISCHPPSYWLRLSSSQTFSSINTPTFSNPVILLTHPPKKMGQCSKTSANKIPTPEKYPEESIQHSEHGESLKLRWPPFTIFNFQENMVHRTCLTLCVIIRQPPLCRRRIMMQFSSYVQENIAYLQLVQWTP